MPLTNVRYRVKQTSKGPVRLAFRGSTVVETKNMKTGALHTMTKDEMSSTGKKMRMVKKKKMMGKKMTGGRKGGLKAMMTGGR